MTTQCMSGIGGARDLAQDRSDLRAQFLSSTPWHQWSLKALSADASFRRYFRLTKGEKSLLLMDSPPATEDMGSYLKVDSFLLNKGLRAPQVYEKDLENGFAIIEDFGSQTYTELLNKGAAAEPLYQLAVDVLAKLHKEGANQCLDVPRYDSGFYEEEAALFMDWYWPARTGVEASSERREEFFGVWQQLLGQIRSEPECLVLRDYHVDNLMLIEGASGIESCGLLDFQDALIGSRAYDLVSLFEDARRDVDSAMSARLLDGYLSGMSDSERDDFIYDYRVLGAHRHIKVLGIFVRLCVRDAKSHYLNYLPRVQRLLQQALQAEELKPLADWLERHHPGSVIDPLAFNAQQLRKMLCE